MSIDLKSKSECLAWCVLLLLQRLTSYGGLGTNLSMNECEIQVVTLSPAALLPSCARVWKFPPKIRLLCSSSAGEKKKKEKQQQSAAFTLLRKSRAGEFLVGTFKRAHMTVIKRQDLKWPPDLLETKCVPSHKANDIIVDRYSILGREMYDFGKRIRLSSYSLFITMYPKSDCLKDHFAFFIAAIGLEDVLCTLMQGACFSKVILPIFFVTWIEIYKSFEPKSHLKSLFTKCALLYANSTSFFLIGLYMLILPE